MPRLTARQLWAQKLLNPASPATSTSRLSRGAPSSLSLSKIPFLGRIMGIDPSLRGTGVAILDFTSGQTRPNVLHSEKIILPASLPMPEALAQIHLVLEALARRFRPRHAALEQTIYVQNFQTAQILGAARGTCMTAVALHKIPVFEYPPLRIKQAVVGVGRASKEQVLRTIQAVVATPSRALSFDEADAIATSLCHAYTWRDPAR